MKSSTILAVAAQVVSVAQGQLTPPPLNLGYLPVPGANLYYETVGSGPLLVFISGANGDADIWRNTALVLSQNFTVCMYDRRGFSRSYLSPFLPQDYANRLATDADDARRLIEHLTPATGPKALVLGSSSGAVVALELLSRYPAVLRTLVAHEPPAIKVLPDSVALAAAQTDAYATYRAAGAPPAMVKFAALCKSAGLTAQILAAQDPRLGGWANTQYWFEREFLPYPLADLNMAAIGASKALLLGAVGNDTDKTAMQYRAITAIARQVGAPAPVVFPGGHTDYAVDPIGFAAALTKALVMKNGGL